MISIYNVLYSGRVPFSEEPRRCIVKENVLRGDRPSFPPAALIESSYGECWKPYVDMVCEGWKADASSRPTATLILQTLIDFRKAVVDSLLPSVTVNENRLGELPSAYSDENDIKNIEIYCFNMLSVPFFPNN
jgi:hypothetical protein